jgi:hypothetical protein
MATEEVWTRTVVNCETGVVEVIPLTDDEIATRKEEMAMAQAEDAARRAALEAREEAKASALAKLEALGLTEEEAAALIS